MISGTQPTLRSLGVLEHDDQDVVCGVGAGRDAEAAQDEHPGEIDTGTGVKHALAESEGVVVGEVVDSLYEE